MLPETHRSLGKRFSTNSKKARNCLKKSEKINKENSYNFSLKSLLFFIATLHSSKYNEHKQSSVYYTSYQCNTADNILS